MLRGLAKRPVKEWAARYAVSPEKRQYVTDRAGTNPAQASPPPAPKGAGSGSGLSQWWTLMQRSHAVANGCFVVAINRVGFEPEPRGPGGIQFFGSSFVAGPDGRVLAKAGPDAPAVVVTTLENAAIERARVGWPFLRDRRIDAYGEITSRWSG